MKTKRKPTQAQRQQAAERRDRFRALVKEIAEMSEERRASLAARMPQLVNCEGHVLSGHNALLVASQFPGATIVGGFRQWLRHGRVVRKGQRGITIFFPRKKQQANGEGPAPGETVEQVELRFSTGTVFDISQTEQLAKGGHDESQAKQEGPEL